MHDKLTKQPPDFLFMRSWSMVTSGNKYGHNMPNSCMDNMTELAAH